MIYTAASVYLTVYTTVTLGGHTKEDGVHVDSFGSGPYCCFLRCHPPGGHARLWCSADWWNWRRLEFAASASSLLWTFSWVISSESLANGMQTYHVCGQV